MRITQVITIVAILIYSGSSLFSQTIQLTLDDAIKMAIESNSNTKIAKMDIKKAQAAVDQAFGNVYPSLNFNSNFTHFIEKPVFPFPDFEALIGNATYGALAEEGLITQDRLNQVLRPIGTELQAFALSNNYEATAEATQILFNSAVFRGIGASEIYVDASKVIYDATVAKTILDVKKAFFGILLLQESLEITNKSLVNFEENLANVRALNNEGLVSEYNLLQAEVQLENFKPTVLQVENSLKSAKDGLKVLLSIEMDKDIELIGELNYNDMDLKKDEYYIDKAHSKNLDLKSLEYKIEIDNAFVDLDRSAYWPSVAAFGNYTFGGQADDFNFLNYRQSIVGVSLSINLFNGMQTKKKVEQSLIAVDQTREQYKLLKEAIASQVRTQLLEIKRVKENLAAQERNVQLAEKGYSIAQTRFKEGTGTQLELLNAENQLRVARNNRLQSIHNFIIANEELNLLLGEQNP